MENCDERSEKDNERESSSSFSEDREALRTYLEKESLIHLDKIFPGYISLDYFKSLTEDDLEHDFHVKDAKQRLELMQAVVKLRDEDSDNDEHEVGWLVRYFVILVNNLTLSNLSLNDLP